MKTIIISLLILTGCSTATEPKVEQALNQNAIILDAIVSYIEELQKIGVLPRPEVLKEETE